ncbi:MAG: TonB-dependent receptor [Flavobacteriales bacterium]|nr:TonB-dependent receptor [Flavobacteriales bacterium]
MIRIKLILLVVCLITTLTAFSQYTLSGNVKDENKNMDLGGVVFYVSDLKTATSTDEQGNYKIPDLKKGTYLIEISFVGYKTLVYQVNVTTDTVINFTMSTTIKELNEVIVTGVTRSTESKLSPIIVKSIDNLSFNQGTSSNLIDGLKNTPGVSQITSGAAISKPVIRGLGYNRVITLNNGIRQEGQQWGDEHGIEIDEYSVGRIEIVKGPGSLMYGSDGIAGVLNFIAPKSPPAGEMKTKLLANYQSNNNLIGYSVSNSGNIKGIQWLGRFSNKFAGNYENAYDGKVFNSGFREFNGNLFLGIRKNWGHTHLNLSNYNTLLNLPEGERDSLGNFIFVNSGGQEVTALTNDLKGYTIGIPHQLVNHFRVASNSYFILNKGTLLADLGYQCNKRKEFGDPVQINDISLFFNLNTFNYNLRYNFKKVKGWETSTGLSGMLQFNANKGLEFLIPDYSLFDAGMFIFTQKKVRKFMLAGGIRFDNRNMLTRELFLDSAGNPSKAGDPEAILKFEKISQSYSGFSGSLGISYQMTKSSTVKFNLSQGFRAPAISELSSNGRHEGAFRYEIGNAGLRSEISRQMDLAFLYNTDHLTFEITPFTNFIDNFIYVEKLRGSSGKDSIPDPDEPAPAFKFTSGNAILYGGELYIDIHPHPLDWLHLENSFSYVRAQQTSRPDSLKNLPFIPAPKYRGEIKAGLMKKGNKLKNAYLMFAVDHYFAQNNVHSAFGTETATPAYTLLSAGLGGDLNFIKRKKELTFIFNLENIMDVAYQNHLSRLKYGPVNQASGRTGMFNMGRNISLKLIFNL